MARLDSWMKRIAVVVLALTPVAALHSNAPEVTLAVPGTSGPRSGTIERFTLRFSEPMVPLGDPRAAAPAKHDCPVKADGRWVDPETYVFGFASPLPGGISCRVTLRDDLTSAKGVAIGGTKSFPIDTGGPSARAVLAGGDEIEEGQVFLVATNSAADPRSVGAYGYCAVDGVGEKIALDVLPASTSSTIINGLGKANWRLSSFLEEAGLPATLPERASDRADTLRRVLAVKCRRPLPPGRDMALVWDAHIADSAGKTVAKDQRFDFTVRKPFTARFACSRVNPQAGCNPVKDATVSFTAPIPRDVALKARITFADGSSRAPTLSNDDKGNAELSDLTFKGPFPEAASATVTLPGGIVDASGRKLANAMRFPLGVQFDRMPPLVKFAAPFGILEAGEGGVLPVTVRAVEPGLAKTVVGVTGASLKVDGSDGAVADWLRKIDDAQDNDFREEKDARGKTHTVNYTGAKSLLAGKGSAMKLDLPGKGKEFEVVGIPLEKPGFYVVELASPALGKALLGRNAPRYVSAGALVTNMAVHFKWGRGNSLAWVTALDSGKPVAGAAVRVSDSCTGKMLAQGTTNAQGVLSIVSGLPNPENYGGCDGDVHPLMVSARSGEDFSFTLTDWGEGIRPYDFDLPYGWSEKEDILHTVFDRTLVRGGESVNMKHILRRPVAAGFQFAGSLGGTLRLVHRGSDTQFEMPFSLGADGIGENVWNVPKGAPMGDYDLQFVISKDKTIFSGQSIRVDEYRLPTMRATISGPRTELVRPTSVPLSLFVGYLSGGGAAGLPVTLRTAFDTGYANPTGWDGWTFGGAAVKEGTRKLDDNGDVPAPVLPFAQTLPLTLDSQGAGQTSVAIGQTIEEPTALNVEMDYEDANGEVLTTSRRLMLHPSAVQIGIKTDGWMMKSDDLRLRFVVLDLDGKPVAGQKVTVALYSRQIITARRRLIGGFYAYDNQEKVTKIDADCSARTDDLGLASCSINPGVSGEVSVVAQTADKDGNPSRAVRSVWLAGADDWWFGGDNGDRMDLVPEQQQYKAGETAKFQVRMPFRDATALVTVEREGVLSSFVTELSGTDPVVSVPMPEAYAPNVYVSVMAVRGRVGGWRLWLADLARRWNLPFVSQDGASPTALVDLAKPSYRIGIAKVQVGWEGHRLSVQVKANKAKYAVRDTAKVDVFVRGPDGKPARDAEIAFAAVDEALLQLKSNESWTVLDAMMGERTLDVLTSTAQTQVVGKRHYGRKAVEAGGGGGADASSVSREDFRPMLLWKGRVKLDSRGHADIAVPLSDNLSAFRFVAIATSGAQLFGSGETTVRTVQDLTIYPGLPPLVRSGDWVGATFMLRNGSDKPMRVTATPKIDPAIAAGNPLTVDIPAGGAAPVTWNLTIPDTVTRLNWTVEARSADGRAKDRVVAVQDVAPLVPTEAWAATFVRVGDGNIPVAPPVGALAGGWVDVKLTDSIAPPLAGVRAYMQAYPYGCFEQQLSKAIVLGDAGAWGALAGALPTYMDGNGLVRYFPSDRMAGSPELTAYVLSATAAAGLPVPEESRARMIEALKAIVEGRLNREAQGPGDDRILKVAALAALARNGASTPALVGAVDMVPGDMPTGTLADWMTALKLTRGLPRADAMLASAEQTLRGRLAYEGTRLDLTDKANAPWWMMVSGDEMAIKALDAVLGRPGWDKDAPRMMIGVAQRQWRGHWDTTPANAWGAILTRRFAERYPASAVIGTTTASLGTASASQRFPMAPDAQPLRLPLATGSLLLRHDGGAGPWATVQVMAAVPLKQPLAAGYRLSKAVTFLSRRNPDRVTRGDVVKVTLTVEAEAERNWVVISDPVAPGATIIGDLGGQSGMFANAADDGDARPDYVERGRDAYRGYFAWLPAGRHVVSYAVRLNGVGTFGLPPSRVEAMYSPSIRAQLPNGGVTVTPQ